MYSKCTAQARPCMGVLTDETINYLLHLLELRAVILMMVPEDMVSQLDVQEMGEIQLAKSHLTAQRGKEGTPCQ